MQSPNESDGGRKNPPPQLMFDDGRRVMMDNAMHQQEQFDEQANSIVGGSTDDVNIEDFYEIERLSTEIVDLLYPKLSSSSSSSSSTAQQTFLFKIALQFPDSALHDSPEVAWMMEKRVDELLKERLHNDDDDKNQQHDAATSNSYVVFCFVLGDTTSNDCCADEVAAQHLDADVLVHYGHACLSAPSGALPILYSFGKYDMNVQETVDVLEQELSSTTTAEDTKESHKFLVLYQVEYHHAMSALKKEWSNRHNNDPNDFEILLGQIPSSLSPSTAERSNTLGGLEFSGLNLDNIEEYTILFIVAHDGDKLSQESTNPRYWRFYVNSMLQILSAGGTGVRYWIYSPPTKTLSTNPESLTALQRQLKRRFFLTMKARDANVFGILVSNLGQQNLVQVVKKLQGMVHDAGKTAYSFAVGKINPAKLANFADIEVFCLVSCQEHTLLDSNSEREDYAIPVITPMELEIAMGKLNWGEQRYSLDCRDVLTTKDPMNASDENNGDDYEDDDSPYFSLVTGQLTSKERRNDLPRKEEGHAGGDTNNGYGTGAIMEYKSEASMFLEKREYRGLETLAGATEAQPAVQGLMGIASKYQQRDNTNN